MRKKQYQVGQSLVKAVSNSLSGYVVEVARVRSAGRDLLTDLCDVKRLLQRLPAVAVHGPRN